MSAVRNLTIEEIALWLEQKVEAIENQLRKCKPGLAYSASDALIEDQGMLQGLAEELRKLKGAEPCKVDVVMGNDFPVAVFDAAGVGAEAFVTMKKDEDNAAWQREHSHNKWLAANPPFKDAGAVHYKIYPFEVK